MTDANISRRFFLTKEAPSQMVKTATVGAIAVGLPGFALIADGGREAELQKIADEPKSGTEINPRKAMQRLNSRENAMGIFGATESVSLGAFTGAMFAKDLNISNRIAHRTERIIEGLKQQPIWEKLIKGQLPVNVDTFQEVLHQSNKNNFAKISRKSFLQAGVLSSLIPDFFILKLFGDDLKKLTGGTVDINRKEKAAIENELKIIDPKSELSDQEKEDFKKTRLRWSAISNSIFMAPPATVLLTLLFNDHFRNLKAMDELLRFANDSDGKLSITGFDPSTSKIEYKVTDQNWFEDQKKTNAIFKKVFDVLEKEEKLLQPSTD